MPQSFGAFLTRSVYASPHFRAFGGGILEVLTRGGRFNRPHATLVDDIKRYAWLLLLSAQKQRADINACVSTSFARICAEPHRGLPLLVHAHMRRVLHGPRALPLYGPRGTPARIVVRILRHFREARGLTAALRIPRRIAHAHLGGVGGR